MISGLGSLVLSYTTNLVKSSSQIGCMPYLIEKYFYPNGLELAQTYSNFTLKEKTPQNLNMEKHVIFIFRKRLEET
jgi:hypothetical protein